MMEKEIFEVYLDDIIPNRFQPRRYFEEKALNDLANSIKQHGIIQPLVVRKIDDKYEIIAGERRFKAAQIAGIGKVPVVIKNLDDVKSAEIALVENLQRQDLTPIEEALSFEKLLKKGDLTQEDLARKMGISQPQIANKLRLLNLDKEVQDAVLLGKISERHARSLLNIDSGEKQKAMLKKIMNKRMTVRETDEEIKKIVGDKITTFEASPEVVNVDSRNEEPEFIENIGGFDVDIDAIKQNSEDINVEKEKNDADLLLGENTKEPAATSTQKNSSNKFLPNFIDEEDSEAQESGNIIESQPEVKPEETVVIQDLKSEEIEEIENLDAPFMLPKTDAPKESETLMSAKIEEPVATEPVVGRLNSAIKEVRNCIREIETAGLNVDAEEFDFEEMYQIIIKIDK